MTPELNETISIMLIVLITHYILLSFGISMTFVLKTAPDHNFPQQLLLVFIFVILWPFVLGMILTTWALSLIDLNMT